MAWSDILSLTAGGTVDLVAAAEVDSSRTDALKKKFPAARIYQDWRQMLDKEAKAIDSVNVSTPDHMHGTMALAAMQLGKHVYGQKPLAHNIREVRRLTEFARQAGVTTQMGIQVHSDSSYRLAVHVVRSGVIGKIREVHSWSNKKWGDESPRPERQDPVPAGLDWDCWLGVASERPFIGQNYYHPGTWRKRLEFGTGTLGDMGCHIIDPVYEALALTAPASIRSEGPAPNAHNWASDALIHYVFPGTDFTEGDQVAVTWYDGSQAPPQKFRSLLEGDDLPAQGSLFFGTKGMMLVPHVARPQLYPIAQFESYRLPRITSNNHWLQFASACRGDGATSAGFDYAGPLTETVLLGALATRFPGTTLKWDAKALQFDHPSAGEFLSRNYRAGWEFDRVA